MASKRVFFSFHYDDVKTFRANVVRKHGLTKETGLAGFFDASIWEDAELHGDNAVKKLIDSSLWNTSVTCVLIGSETWKRRWVRYEIIKSYERGNYLLGIHINSIRDKNNNIFLNGRNPFEYIGFFVNNDGSVNTYQENNGFGWFTYSDYKPIGKKFNKKYAGRGYKFSNWVPCYDWVKDNGYINFGKWIQ